MHTLSFVEEMRKNNVEYCYSVDIHELILVSRVKTVDPAFANEPVITQVHISPSIINPELSMLQFIPVTYDGQSFPTTYVGLEGQVFPLSTHYEFSQEEVEKLSNKQLKIKIIILDANYNVITQKQLLETDEEKNAFISLLSSYA